MGLKPSIQEAVLLQRAVHAAQQVRSTAVQTARLRHA
jgi:hypothetical protein